MRGLNQLGPVQFDQPQWLLLLLLVVPLLVWWGRQSLSGLGTTSRRVALGVRIVVVVLLVGALAKPHWRKDARNVTVNIVLDVSDSVPKDLQRRAVQFFRDARVGAKTDDLWARVTAARGAYVQALPAAAGVEPDTVVTGATDGTNLAEALRLAMAVMPSDTGNRIVIASDGNETTGDLLSAASAASAKGIPIDVLPLRFRYENEVVVERIIAPTTARVGQNINLRVLIGSQKPTRGRLSLLANGIPIALDPERGGTSREIEVAAGLDAITIPLTLPVPGPQTYEAIIEPLEPASDSIRDNNRALAVTFVQAEGRVLVLAPSDVEAEPLIRALRESKIDANFRNSNTSGLNPVEIASYDAVVMVNTPAGHFSDEQHDLLRAYVHDLGGGLIMVGGPDSFGAGGWTGTPTADALPVKLDPPAKRQMPRGALVLVMHSCEMPQGNYWGKKTAEAAIQNLTRLDMAGIVEAGWTGDSWTFPLSEVGNKAAIMRAVNSMTYGDAPSFDGMLQMAYDALSAVDAGAKHIIIISDGDPSFTRTNLLGLMRQNRISVSTVLVYPHTRTTGGPEWQLMSRMARETGGRFYPIIDEGDFAQLPSIFIKEATVVKRSLRYEGAPFAPTMANVISEPLRGIGSLPPISGYIVGADRDGLSVVSARGRENDPILAHWQHGLGKSVAFMSDAGAAYARGWPGWDRYRQFWEQHVRWAMRPGGSSEIRVATEDLGEQTKVIVDALDDQGERLNFVRFRARVLGPEGEAQGVELRQTAPGRYEGVFDTSRAGAYITNLQYTAPGRDGRGPQQGSVQTAVTRPFAKEYRALQDNAPLLRLVAERTGGRVLDADPTRADLWSRAGLAMPVALTSIWLEVALLAVGLFLTDVAVRRVRFDPRAIAAAIRRGVGKGRSGAGEQIGSLKEARKRAQEGIKQRTDLSAEQKAAALRQAKMAATQDQETSKAKFEVSDAELRKSKRITSMAEDGSAADRPRAKSAPSKAAGDGEQGESGISRLRKAKERAREEMKRDEEKGGGD
ncbi:MAG: VWA domain-containing protein [Phycisphaeraceae bacterium]|nr:VWA domain-containing protein [Phycisphaeraceae bacterium]